MDMNSMIILSGLVALLVSYTAVRDSQDGWGGSVGQIRWAFSGSWASSSAVILALVFTTIGVEPSGMLLGLGLMMVLAPLVYRGMGGGENVSKPVFFIVASFMTWATFAILYAAAAAVPSMIEPLPLLPTFIIYAFLVLALLGAVMNSVRSLSEAASGGGSEAWTLP